MHCSHAGCMAWTPAHGGTPCTRQGLRSRQPQVHVARACSNCPRSIQLGLPAYKTDQRLQGHAVLLQRINSRVGRMHRWCFIFPCETIDSPCAHSCGCARMGLHQLIRGSRNAYDRHSDQNSGHSLRTGGATALAAVTVPGISIIHRRPRRLDFPPISLLHSETPCHPPREHPHWRIL